jgi:hypothetical protein
MPAQSFRLSSRIHGIEKASVNARGEMYRTLKFVGGSFRLDAILLIKCSVLHSCYEVSTKLH